MTQALVVRDGRVGRDKLERLREMCLRNPRPSNEDMAAAFHCSPAAIQTVMSRKGLIRNAAITGAAWKNEKRPVACMICRKPFVSEGIHNRQCPGCYAINSEIAA